ncbi:ABC transporter permease [Dictyobacter formicarum]|uniref:ABC transporter permease n=1 Tax=Dictyobacter formicarum TaxID=2778368 RepID=A0ABQ3VSN3_9CHLR|nr:hypothetical protein [Dictyobacter formicarum]GHO88331.1 hypothetical protein KSZ_63370 [Dictyobacter formicarum]
MSMFATLLGAFKYEFRMQIRRPWLWITMGFIQLIILGFMFRTPGVIPMIQHLKDAPLVATTAYWTNIVNYLLPVAVAILIADRLPRDKRTHVQEILTTLPGSSAARLWGKYLGSTLATLLPILIFYTLGILVIFVQTLNAYVFLLAIATFVTIILPGMLLVGAVAIATPALIWVPLFQFLFVGYWFWGNLYKPHGIPTLSDTILTPAGGYMSRGFFGVTVFPVERANAVQGLASMLLLLGLAVLIMLALNGYQQWQQRHQ